MRELDEPIPLARPSLRGNELRYVTDVIESSWVSSTGDYLNRLEREFAAVCGVDYAIACASGTAALHLAIEGLGIGHGDEVLVPTLTYVASVNAVCYTGALPVLVDSDLSTWNICPADLRAKVNAKTRAVMAVHLYGNPAELDVLRRIADDHDLYVIEDAAEALGATWRGGWVGGIGDVGVFSFYGNKVVTTGEGGMVTTNSESLAGRIRQLRGQGQSAQRRYWFPIRGFNYRLTNLQAALGVAQLERLEHFLSQRAAIAQWYMEMLGHVPGVVMQECSPYAVPVNWLFSVVLQGIDKPNRDAVIEHMLDRGVETRPFFYPMHEMPVYQYLKGAASYPNAESLAASGLSLPTWVGMRRAHVERVCKALVSALSRVAPSKSG